MLLTKTVRPRTMMHKRVHRIVTLALGVMLGLAGCSGGGGDAAAPGGPGGGPDTTSRGLLPAAPVPGAVLFADATVLRPFIEGARWYIRGSHVSATGATPVIYRSTTSHSEVTSGSTLEAFSQPLNGSPDSQRVVVSGGAIYSDQDIDFSGLGRPETLRFVELRSPVRANEQYTVFDRRFTETNIDLDGDRRADTLDVAVYTRVLGLETLALPNLPEVTALRTESVMRQRVTLSSNGSARPVQEVVLETWYVAGVGVVRQRLRAPTVSGSDVSVHDEQLESWDGIATGLGAMVPQVPTVAANSGASAGQPVPSLQHLIAAHVVGDSALLVTRLPNDASGDLGTLIHRMERSGRVSSSVHHPDMRADAAGTGFVPGAGMLLRWQFLGTIGSYPAAPESWRFALSRFDAQGAAVSAAGGAILEVEQPAGSSMDVFPRWTIVDNTLWLLWERSRRVGVDTTDEVVLRPYRLDGQPLAPERVLETGSYGALSIAPSQGGVFVTWFRMLPGLGYESRYARAGLDGSLVGPGTLMGGFSRISGQQVQSLPIGMQDLAFWYSPIDAGFSGPLAGALINAQGQPVLPAGEAAVTQVVGGFWQPGITTPTAVGQRLVMVERDPTELWPAVNGSTGVLAERITWFDVTPGVPLSQTARRVVRSERFDTWWQLQWADRVLLLSGDPWQMRTQLVWLNAP